MKAWKHFKTITHHKALVLRGCFQVGLYWQGLTHDMSKYSPSEFLVGARYFQGERSPNNAEREERGYSSAWLHHKGRNKHHSEYWVDYSSRGCNGMVAAPMPTKYIVEMFVDRIAASKVYNKQKYTDQDPLMYYEHGKASVPIHDDTRVILEGLLTILAQQGEKETFAYIKNNLLHKK